MHSSTRWTNESNDLTSAYLKRIEWLRSEGVCEHITVNEASVRDFFAFVDAASYSLRASLVLHDNGNIRALWRLDGEDRIGIQFRGDGNASFVIFNCIASGGAASQTYGVDTLDGVRARIRACGFEAKLGGRATDA